MKLLYELESQAGKFIVERMRQIIADALSGYKPMRQERCAAIAHYRLLRVNHERQVRRYVAGRPCISPRGYAGRIVELTGEKALYWRVKEMRKGLTHLRTGANRDTAQHQFWSGSIVRYERERMGAMWTVQNLLVLL